MIVIDSVYKFFIDGIFGTAAANTTTNFDYQMGSSWALYGFSLIQNGGTFGDYVTIKVVDKDNVLGFGANLVVATIITKGYIDPQTTRVVTESEYARTIPAGLYIRIAYTNTNALLATQVAANFRFINPS